MTTHTVRRGETISSIAKIYSVDVDALVKENSIADANRIALNTTLTIPAKRNLNAAAAKLPQGAAEPISLKTIERDIGEALEGAWASGKRIAIEWMEELLQRLRTQEANESVQQEEKVPLSKQAKPVSNHQERAKKKGSRSKKSLDEVKAKLKEKLGKEPHVITFNGVKLTENEKKQIVAAVAVCEMNSDGFGSINADQEFVGRKFGKRGSEQPYSRIVHIGLSYGLIQYSQDSGSLGVVLLKMRDRNSSKFIEIFGGGDQVISKSLLDLTNSGRPDLVSNANIPISGQAYWNKIKKTPDGKETHRLSNTDADKDGKSDLPVQGEIRGKRVQPIPPATASAAIDIWTGVWKERFLAAGKVVDFQEAQLEIAVEKFMNPILKRAQKSKIRSALGLAFVTACSIRGGPNGALVDLLENVAKELKIDFPFGASEDERKCIDAIANGAGQVKKLKFDADESRRAALLVKDELGFLAEDLYDTSTYA